MVPKDSPTLPQPQGRPKPVVTKKIAAEAASWISRLHGPDRTPEMEREFREWVARSEAHGYAFERCTDIWTDVKAMSPDQIRAGIARRDVNASMARARSWQRYRWLLAAMLLLLIAAAGYAVNRWMAVDMYRTEVGGQQQVLLADGTRMSLNTETKVRVELDTARRLVTVDAGEVMFEVAKDPRRPFIVRAGTSEVIAVGTVFSVRVPSTERSDEALAVVLVEGEVSVQPALGARLQGAVPAQRISMHAGERMRMLGATGDGRASAPQIDRPPVETLLAWRHGKAIFDDLTLREAVGEMNRYTRTPIILVGDVSELRIAGSYDTGNAQSFVQAVAVLHGLQVRALEGRVELARPQ